MTTTYSKRKLKVLNYTTGEFILRLQNRGYPIHTELKSHLDSILQSKSTRKDTNCHTNVFWSSLEDRTLTSLQQTAPHFVNIADLCAHLSPLSALQINYINLAVVLYTLNAQEWKNLYRYYYLEWMTCNNGDILWEHTPRFFSKQNDFQLQQMCTDFLDFMMAGCHTDNYVRSLFFINRLYQYLTPCG